MTWRAKETPPNVRHIIQHFELSFQWYSMTWRATAMTWRATAASPNVRHIIPRILIPRVNGVL
jgi:hypothetical protein